MADKSKKRIWGLVDRLEGDKVVWIIVLLLLLLSVIFLFSSTSRLLVEGQTRLDVMISQFKMVAASLLIIVICYNIRNINFLRWCSHWGFTVSLILLILLQFIGSEYNGAVRCIKIGGFQFHVFEVVKVAMVMYMAWAIDALKRGRFKFIDKLSEIEHLEWLAKPAAKKLICIYLPFAITTVLVMTGSNSSAVFIAGVMLLTIAVGGSDFKDLLVMGAIGVVGLSICIGLYSLTKTSEHPVFARVGTAVSRIKGHDWEREYILADEEMRQADNISAKAVARNKKQLALDNLRQPYSAKLAISQGGFFGKGPGQSTQRYVVPDMSEDYMFSFILEEYGFLGALLIIALYVSLVARGSLIVRNCGTNVFAKTAIAGLTLLISGQAFLHIMVNADIGPMTGQTLPLLSHGNSALLCFSLAFGIILSISRIAQKGIARATKAAAPIVVETAVEAEAMMDVLDQFDTNGTIEEQEITDEYEQLI